MRKALLYHKNGCYYADYIYNELQVKVANWLTLMAVDRPVTLGELGTTADQLAALLADRNAGDLTVSEVLTMVKSLVEPLDEVVYERLLLNETTFANELATLLIR